MANTRFKTDHGLNATANSIVDGQLQVTGDLIVDGDLVFDATIAGNFTPDADQRNLGQVSPDNKRWNLYGFTVSVGNTLTVTNTSVLSNTLQVVGATTLQNTLSVTGWVNTAANLEVGGSANVTGRVNVAGNVTVIGILSANANTTFTNGLLTVNTNSSTSANTVRIGNANLSVNSGTLFVDAVNQRVGINNSSPGVALRVTGAVDISSSANVQGSANIAGYLDVNGNTSLAGNVDITGTSHTISGNVNIGSGGLFYDKDTKRIGINTTSVGVALTVVGSANISAGVNSSQYTVGTSLIANTFGIYHTGTVNAASYTVGTSFTANSAGITASGFANIATSVNSALFTVGTNFIANTFGLYHTGVVNAATLSTGVVSATTNGFIANTTAIVFGNSSVNVSVNTSSLVIFGSATSFVNVNPSLITVRTVNGLLPFSNTSGYQLGSASARWDLKAQSGDFSGGLTVGDNEIVLISGLSALTEPSQSANLVINRGAQPNVSLSWNETGKYWSLGNTVINGYVNATSGDFSADLEVGGVGVGFTANVAELSPKSNTIKLGNTTGQWIITANTITVKNTTLPSTFEGPVATGSMTITGTANVTTSVNTALFTVANSTGVQFRANASQLFINGTIEANASIETANIVANSSGIIPSPATNLMSLGNTTSRWILLANSGDFSSSLRFSTTLTANGSTGTSGQVLVSAGSGANAYWGAVNAFSTDISLTEASPAVYFADTSAGLPVSNNAARLQFDNGTFSLIQADQGDGTANTRVTFNMTNGDIALDGTLRAVGDVIAYSSDGRLKNISETIPDPLGKINKISGVYYTYNELAKSLGIRSQGQQVGVIAQEIQEVLPEVVKPAPFDTGPENTSLSGSNYLTVQYEKIVPLLIEAVKHLHQKVQDLEEHVRELKNGNKG